jgi:hypothetical protein
MRAGRFFLFLLSILVGLGVGVAYGWVINPPPYRDLTPATLRQDYKADYVLMVAEIYREDSNVSQALRRLTQLDSQTTPARLVAEALLTARDLEYAPADLEALAALAQAVQLPVEASSETSGDATPTLLVPKGTP